jgi:hypothetical protein
MTRIRRKNAFNAAEKSAVSRVAALAMKDISENS